MNVDVLIIYELKTRELENACLLMVELKRRGYTVEIVNVYDPRKYNIHPKLMVVPHLYNDWHLDFTCNNKWHDCKCIIDLQYEQVLKKGSDGGIHNPTGQAAFAHHIAWGELQAQRYLTHGIRPDLVHITGHITMDFIKPRFRSFFLAKEKLAKRYKLDESKEWVLFMSSFSYANRTESELKMLETMSSTARSFAKLSQQSFDIIIPWLKQAANENPDKLFIYRPHPGEKDNPVLKALQVEIPNIYVINEFAVKQWIITCDRLYTWFSTSITEAYYAGKNCQILRPIPIDPAQEVSIMDGAKMLTSYEEFETSLKSNDEEFPITEEAMTYAYGDGKTYAYENTADLCERVMKDKKEQYDFKFDDNADSFLKRIFWKVFTYLGKNVKAPWIPSLQNNYYYRQYRLYNKEMYGLRHQIKAYERILSSILNAN